MKPTLHALVLVLFAGTASHAQFSLTPQAGFEQSRTALNYGNGLSAADINGNIKAGLKLDYRFKTGHTPFVNLTTSPAPVNFIFDNVGSLVGTSRELTPLFRLEAGYGYATKAIRLGKKSTTVSNSNGPQATTESFTQQRTCGGYRAMASRCGQRKLQKLAPVDNTLNLRLQPSVAFAYVPAATEGVKQTSNGFQYAADWQTAIVPAVGFELAKGARRLLTLNVFYTKPLSEVSETGMIASGAKAISVPVQPRTSTWGLTLGVPFSFAKAAQSRSAKSSRSSETKRQCHRTAYRRCGQWQ